MKEEADSRKEAIQILTGVHYCLDTLLTSSVYLAYQRVFGSNPAHLRRRRGDYEDLTFTQVAALSGQAAQQWQMRVMAQEAASKETVDNKLLRALARNKSLNCVSRGCAPRWRGLAATLDFDGTGVAAKFRGQSLREARFCVRPQVGPVHVGGVKWNPGHDDSGALDGISSVTSGKTLGNDRAAPERGGSISTPPLLRGAAVLRNYLWGLPLRSVVLRFGSHEPEGFLLVCGLCWYVVFNSRFPREGRFESLPHHH